MLAQHLWVKWVGIIIKNSIYIVILLLITPIVEKLFNITFSYIPILIGAICYSIYAEIIEYRKWLRNGAAF